jgi:acyl carrier protein phosphodiesterase
MNFLAHTALVADDEQLLLGGLLGDFVRGLVALRGYPPDVRQGIRLHRFIDRSTDQSAEVKVLCRSFPKPFRRYAGIIVDLAFDHELAKTWGRYSSVSLADFDLQVREVLQRHEQLVPPRLASFMRYAQLRGLFAAYQHEDEMLLSLAGLGQRLRRANPLHRVNEIWPDVRADCSATFAVLYPWLQGEVADWRKRKSTSTGS